MGASVEASTADGVDVAVGGMAMEASMPPIAKRDEEVRDAALSTRSVVVSAGSEKTTGDHVAPTDVELAVMRVGV